MNEITQSVLAAERARAAALVARDAAALDVLLHEDLVYVHATGVKHNRAQLLAFLHDGPRFLSVQLQEPQIRHPAEGVALVTGLLKMRLCRATDVAAVEVASLASQAWLRTDGSWRLVLFQSTSLRETP